MISKILSDIPFQLQGLVITIEVAAIVILLSLIVGIIAGVLMTHGPRWIFWPIRLYVDMIRGVPVLVVIFFIYYGLPIIGINLNNFWAACFALTGFISAHVTEVARGSIQSIPRGQVDASKAIGLTLVQCLWYVIFPQAIRRFLPPWLNVVAETVKGTSLVSLVGVVDLMLATQEVIGRTFEPIPFYITAAVMYFAVIYSLSRASRRLESRFANI